MACQPIMTSAEIHALMLCKESFCKHMDPLSLSSQLYFFRNISKDLYVKMVVLFNDGYSLYYISEQLIKYLPHQTNLFAVTQAISKCGYYQLASKILLCMLGVTAGIGGIKKSCQDDRKSLHKYYRQLTVMLSDAQFSNPKAALRSLAKRSRINFVEETNPMKKQWLADKLFTILAVEIDAYAITADTGLSQNELFSEMNRLKPYTKNTLVSDVVYFARLATAYTLSKDFEQGEEMLLAAKTSACNTGQCLELMTLISIEVCFRLREFEMTPTKELQNTIMMLGRIGLESLEFEDYDTKLMWRRIFILRMVFCLLGIGKCTNLINNCEVDNESIRISEELLSKLDVSFEGMDQRRKMFYYVAKARLFQCREHTEEADMYIRKAEELAVSGNFMESKFILELRKYMENQVTTKLMPNMYVYCEKDETKVLPQLNSSERENATSMTQPNKLPKGSQNIQDHFVKFVATVELANKASDTVDQQIYRKNNMSRFTNQNVYLKETGNSETYNADNTFPKEICKSDGKGLLTVSDASNKDETTPKEKRWSSFSDVHNTSNIDETSPKEIDVLEICNMEKTFPKEVYQTGFSDHSATRHMDETFPKHMYQTGEINISDLSETCSMYKTAPKEIFLTSDMDGNDVSKFCSTEETFPKEIYQTGERDFIDLSKTCNMDETSPKEIYQMAEKGYIDVLETRNTHETFPKEICQMGEIKILDNI